MEEKTVKEKRANTLDELSIARMEVEYKRLLLKKTLEDVNKILRLMKKTRKVISCLTFLKSNWLKNNDYENQLKEAATRLKDFSNLYKITILKRKLLKNEFKRAQRKYSKKWKRLRYFDKKYY